MARVTKRFLDPALQDLSPRHLELFWRYQVVRTGVDFGAAICFVIGSVFFFYESLSTPADCLFLIGSILFAVKPTIDMVRSVHLRRLPTGDTDTGSRNGGGVPAAAG